MSSASVNRFTGLPIEGDESAAAPAVRITIRPAEAEVDEDKAEVDEGKAEAEVDEAASLKAKVTNYPTHLAMIKSYNPTKGVYTIMLKDNRTLRGYTKEFKKPVGVWYKGWAEDRIEDDRRAEEGETEDDREPLEPPYIAGFEPGTMVFAALYTIHTKDPRSGEKRSHTNVWNVRPAIQGDSASGKFVCGKDEEFETTDEMPERQRAKCYIRSAGTNVFKGVCSEWNNEDWKDDRGHLHRKGTGYLEYEGLDGREYKIHVHFSALAGTPEGKFKRLYEDQEVEFVVKTTRKNGRTMRCAEQVTGPDATYFARPSTAKSGAGAGAGAAASDDE